MIVPIRLSVLCWLAVSASQSAWATGATAAAAPDLGTLFYTPAERQAITRAHQPQQGEVGVVTTTIHLSGVVARAAGKGTAWLNGQSVAEGKPSNTRIRGTDVLIDGKRLRVGESVDTSTGARSDVVPHGAVTIRSRN